MPKKAFELDTSDFTLNILALSYMHNGYYEKSNDIYDKMLSMNLGEGSDALTWMNKGIDFNKLEMYTAAILCSHRALELNPDDKRPLTNVGINHSHLKKYDNAFAYLKQANEFDSTMIEIHISYAELYKHIGNDFNMKNKYYPLSIAEYEKVIKLDKNEVWKEESNDKIAKLKNEMK